MQASAPGGGNLALTSQPPWEVIKFLQIHLFTPSCSRKADAFPSAEQCSKWGWHPPFPSSQSASPSLDGLSPISARPCPAAGSVLVGLSSSTQQQGPDSTSHVLQPSTQTHRSMFKRHMDSALLFPQCTGNHLGAQTPSQPRGDLGAGSANEAQAVCCRMLHRESSAPHLTSVLVLRWVHQDAHACHHQWEEHAAHVHHPLETQSSASCPEKPNQQHTLLLSVPAWLPVCMSGCAREKSPGSCPHSCRELQPIMGMVPQRAPQQLGSQDQRHWQSQVSQGCLTI